MNLALRRKPFTMKEKVLLFFVKFLINDCLHALKLALNANVCARLTVNKLSTNYGLSFIVVNFDVICNYFYIVENTIVEC